MILPLAIHLATQAHAQDEVRRFALLIGHNDGGEGRARLRYAHDDAEEMATVLEQLGGVSSENAILLLDPDLAALEDTLQQVRTELAEAGGKAEFLFYYSGHSDEEGLLLGEDRYGYRELRGMLDQMPARVRLAILDSCASGALILAKGGSRSAPFLVDRAVQVDGFAYMTSSSADEAAQEAERIGGSYFTHYLASGLRGAADLSGDGRVTLNEAYSFANSETLAHTEKTQHGPQHAAYDTHLSGTGELVLTDLGMTSASLVLDESLFGRTLVRDVDGNLIVELQKIAGRAIELGLAEGRYTVTLLHGEDRYGEVTVDVALGSSMPVSASEIRWHSAEPTVARGGTRVELPPVSVVQPEKELRIQRFPQFSLLGIEDVQIDKTFVFGLWMGRSQELSGVALSLGGYHVNDEVKGVEAALGFASAGSLDGFQGGLGMNRLGEGGEGVQLSVGANIAGSGDFEGGQLTVGMNQVGGEIRGSQLSMGANFAAGGMRGFQGTVGLNVAGKVSEGVQLSTGLNVANTFTGAQISLMNVGGDVDGLQLGLLNIGRDVNGAQIGLINIARDVDGAPIGLLSVVKEGRHDVLVYVTETDLANVDLKLGGDHFYTVLGAGAGLGHGYTSFGFGTHFTFGERVWGDVDLLGAAYVALGPNTLAGASNWTGPPTAVVRPRATVGFQLAKELAPFVGTALNVRIPDVGELDPGPQFLQPEIGDLVAWPSVFAGVQF